MVAAKGPIESFKIVDGQKRRGQDFPIFVSSESPYSQRIGDAFEPKDFKEIEDWMAICRSIAS